jgi:exodeoxyribonuclease VII small subunit
VGTKRDGNGESTAPAITFEEALAQLEAVVRVLEDGHVGLDESLAKYEEGVRLLRVCRDSLQTAERKIMLLTGIDANGNPLVEPFGDEASSLEEKKEMRTRRRSRTGNPPAKSDPCEDDGDSDGLSEADKQKGLF